MITREEFLAFYPQFSAFEPALVLDTFLLQANARFSSFGEDAAEARRLYAAHKLTLYAKSAPPEGTEASMAVLASAGEKQQQITSQKVGEVAVTYASSSSSSSASAGRTSLADLPETVYGLQLLALIRMHVFGMYVP